ncbi:MAG TPA: LysR substrate-binding domain-containing protein [Rhizomicrobium sp.]|nr:LysR substrate-binding domain-containing protein [Rhizomicrobium sp.]
MLNTRQLEALAAVIETGTVTAAATRLRITQPAVSNLIANLERATGLKLFHRERKRLHPTAEARMLHAEIEKIFHGAAHIARVAGEIRALQTGSITLAALPSFGLHYLPHVIARFAATRPGLNIALQVRDSPKIVEWAIAQQIDLGISKLTSDHPAVRSELLHKGSGLVVLPNGHPLAERDRIAPIDLEGERFISLGWEDRSRHLIDQVFDEAGVIRQLSIETQLSEVACSFVENGAGVSIVDPFTARDFAQRGALVARAFTVEVAFDIRLIWPGFRAPSIALNEFVGFLRNVIETDP